MKRFIPILVALIGVMALSPPATATKNPFAQDNLGHRWWLFDHNPLDTLQDSINVQGAAQRRDVARDSVLVKTNTTAIAKMQDSLNAQGAAQRRDVARDSVLVKTNTTNIAAAKAVIDSINSQRPVTVRSTTVAWAATKGPVTGFANGVGIISGTGIWRIEALGAVAVAGNSATATTMGFALGQNGGAATLLSTANGITLTSDVAGTTYMCPTDTVVAGTEVAPLIPFYFKENTSISYNIVTKLGGIADSTYVPVYSKRYLQTPVGAWTITDSTSATNTGTRYLWMRAIPFTPGATIVGS